MLLCTWNNITLENGRQIFQSGRSKVSSLGAADIKSNSLLTNQVLLLYETKTFIYAYALIK